MNAANDSPPPPALAPYEKAARIYCERHGYPADQQIPEPHPVLQGAVLYRPMWEMVAERPKSAARVAGPLD